jgi:CheY-like chemotaxis protein
MNARLTLGDAGALVISASANLASLRAAKGRYRLASAAWNAPRENSCWLQCEDSPAAAKLLAMAERLLLVDDNRRFLDAATALLEREGMVVVACTSKGAEAMRLAEQLNPEVALVDISLGEESGFDVARSLTQLHAGCGPRVILISTHSAGDFADLIQASPAVAFLAKAELSGEAIRRALASAPRSAGPTVTSTRGTSAQPAHGDGRPGSRAG